MSGIWTAFQSLLLEKTLLVLKPKDNAYGARTLSVVVGNTLRTLQEAKNELEIVFDTRK
jgi:hypothetical protein